MFECIKDNSIKMIISNIRNYLAHMFYPDSDNQFYNFLKVYGYNSLNNSVDKGVNDDILKLNEQLWLLFYDTRKVKFGI